MASFPNRLRALLHLYDNRKDSGKVSRKVTQEGIADALGIARGHVTRVVRPLVEEGLAEEWKGRLKEENRRLKVYSITPRGIEEARRLVEASGGMEVRVLLDGEERSVRISSLLREYPRLSTLRLLDALDKGEPLVLTEGRRIVSNVRLESPEICDRERELETATHFLGSEATALVVFANHGYGSSVFLRKVALDLSRRPLFWHDLAVESDPAKLSDALDLFAREMGCHTWHDLSDREALLCFDNYRDAPEGLVDLFIEMFQSLRGGSCKMLVAMRAESPPYARFFEKEHVDAGELIEVRLGRLDRQSAEEILGDLDEEALQLIYMMTRGQPLALKLVRDGQAEELKRLFPNEEVRFLMYLRSRRR